MTTNCKIPLFLFGLFIGAFAAPIPASADEGDCSVQTITGTVTFPASWGCDWLATNPNEIARNSSGLIRLKNGRLPFQWQMSGNGFWFDAAHTITTIQTIDPSVTVYVGSSACGSATLTATDSSGCSTTGTVRTNAGSWVLVTRDQCVMSGTYNYTIGGWFGLVRGGMKQELVTYYSGACRPGGPGYSCSNPCPGVSCSSIFQTYRYCLKNGVGCQDCLNTGIVPCVARPDICSGCYDCRCVRSIYYYEWRCN
jgi:hypothetical protein